MLHRRDQDLTARHTRVEELESTLSRLREDVIDSREREQHLSGTLREQRREWDRTNATERDERRFEIESLRERCTTQQGDLQSETTLRLEASEELGLTRERIAMLERKLREAEASTGQQFSDMTASMDRSFEEKRATLVERYESQVSQLTERSLECQTQLQTQTASLIATTKELGEVRIELGSTKQQLAAHQKQAQHREADRYQEMSLLKAKHEEELCTDREKHDEVTAALREETEKETIHAQQERAGYEAEIKRLQEHDRESQTRFEAQTRSLLETTREGSLGKERIADLTVAMRDKDVAHTQELAAVKHAHQEELLHTRRQQRRDDEHDAHRNDRHSQELSRMHEMIASQQDQIQAQTSRLVQDARELGTVKEKLVEVQPLFVKLNFACWLTGFFCEACLILSWLCLTILAGTGRAASFRGTPRRRTSRDHRRKRRSCCFVANRARVVHRAS